MFSWLQLVFGSGLLGHTEIVVGVMLLPKWVPLHPRQALGIVHAVAQAQDVAAGFLLNTGKCVQLWLSVHGVPMRRKWLKKRSGGEKEVALYFWVNTSGWGGHLLPMHPPTHKENFLQKEAWVKPISVKYLENSTFSRVNWYDPSIQSGPLDAVSREI